MMLLATSYSLNCHATAQISNSNSSTSSNSNHTKSLKNSTQRLARASTLNKTSDSLNASTTTATTAARSNRNVDISNDINVQKLTQNATASRTNATNNEHTNNSTKKTTNLSSNYRSNAKNTYNAKIIGGTSSAFHSSANKTAPIKIAPTAAFLKIYTVPPTVLHRCAAARIRSCSIDSLHDEMCHFKPIRSLPLTPLKTGSHSRGFCLKTPKPQIGTNTKNCDLTIDAIKRVVDRENQRGKLKPKRRNETRLSSSIFQNLKPHLSAFVRLQPNATVLLQPNCIATKQAINNKPIKKTTSTAKTRSAKLIEQMEQNMQKTISAAGNLRKRKAQNSATKSTELTSNKKPKLKAKNIRNEFANRKTPPLTRSRVRMTGNKKLFGPLV